VGLEDDIKMNLRILNLIKLAQIRFLNFSEDGDEYLSSKEVGNVLFKSINISCSKNTVYHETAA
jgi:hypothetical protein